MYNGLKTAESHVSEKRLMYMCVVKGKIIKNWDIWNGVVLGMKYINRRLKRAVQV